VSSTITNGQQPAPGVLVVNAVPSSLPIHQPGLTAEHLETLAGLVNNLHGMRRELIDKLADPRRDYEKECGHKKDPTAEDYQQLYNRHPLANRAVNVLPKETWQVQPSVYELEDPETMTPFEQGVKALSTQLRGERSWHAQTQGSLLWQYLRRVDGLSRIGSYGVILLGFDDVTDSPAPGHPLVTMADAVTGVDPLDPRPRQTRKLLYMRVMPQSMAQVTAWEQNKPSPRYGQPKTYLITINDPRDFSGSTAAPSTGTMTVHWTRVVHINEHSSSSEWASPSCMEPFANRLWDSDKLYGGSAEMYWRGAFPGLSLETHPSLGGDVAINERKLKEMFQDYSDSLGARALFMFGMTAKTLAPVVVDPTPQLAVQIEAICIALAIPKRIFMGSERGELASTQDDDSWNDRLKQRQADHVTPRIIVPFFDRLISAGALPEPGPQGYQVWWPDLTSMSDQQKATIGLTRAQAIALYFTSEMRNEMTFLDFLVTVLGVKEEEALNIVHSAAEAAEELAAEDTPASAEPVEVPLDATDGGTPAEPGANPVAPAEGQS
jgi:hypothetical protein